MLRTLAARRPLDGPAALRAGPGDDDDEEETPIGDPDDDDEGDDSDDDDDDDEEPLRCLPRPPKGPGDGEDDELPMGDPPDDDPTDDPDDEDEGEGDEEPLQGEKPCGSGFSLTKFVRLKPDPQAQLQPRSR
jgi:hypothetical protein